MKKQKVFIPVEHNSFVVNTSVINPNPPFQPIPVKEQEGYLFTAEELKTLISEVYEVGFLNPIGRDNYIKSLNIK